jgi:peptidoglycan/xylan/chitin deacetylase (PgdA/CDA1 family)
MITFPRLIILVVLGLLLGVFASAPVEAARLTVGGTARVVTDDGTGLNLREQPSRQADRVGTANEGDTVAVVDGPFTDENGDTWYLVEAGDVTGYAVATFLVASDGEAVSSRQSSSGLYQYGAADVGLVPVLMYHHIDYSGGTYAVTPEQLSAQMQWLADNGYTSITLTDFYNGAFAGGLLPAKPVVLTVDDGWASALTFADILSWYGFTGNYFITTEGELTWDQIAYLGQIGEVENHTTSHPALSVLGYGDQYAEIANNAAYLQGATGQAVQFIAWPYGDWNWSAVQAASDSGLIAGFDAWGGPAYLSSLDPWHIPRILISGDYDLATFASVVQG